jgi:hypothetical protein
VRGRLFMKAWGMVPVMKGEPDKKSWVSAGGSVQLVGSVPLTLLLIHWKLVSSGDSGQPVGGIVPTSLWLP